MSVISWNPSLSASDLDKLWRIVQLPLATAFNFISEEVDLLSRKVPRLRINLSARQMILPLDLKEDYGIASIPEGGDEAVPVSPNAVDSQFSWITLHGRFALTRTARHLDKGGNAQAMVMKQIKYQGMKKVQALKRRVRDYVYGFSTGVIAKVSGVAGSVITPKDLYSVSGLGGADDWKRVFKVGDRIGVIDPGGPTLDNTEAITAINATTGALTVADATGFTANDLLVFANAVEDAVLAATDYLKGLPGFIDLGTSTSYQNVSGSTHPEWVAYQDSAGGQWGTLQLRKGQQAVRNRGGGEIDTIVMDQGVDNDLTLTLRTGLRYNNAFQLEIDGKASTKGIEIKTPYGCPPGYVFGWDKANGPFYIQLLEGMDQPGWDEAEKVPNRAAFVFPIDWPIGMGVKNRANFAIWSNKTRQ